MYLSRLILNERSTEVRRDLADCHQLHRRILRAFPDAPDGSNPREYFGVLYRLETPELTGDNLQVLVQSASTPIWGALPSTYLLTAAEVKPIAPSYERITAGMTFRFRLRANPTKRIAADNTTETARWHGRRVDLRREDEQITWLQRKAEQHGFAIVDVATAARVPAARIVHEGTISGRSVQHAATIVADRRMSFGSVLFDGLLEVADAEQLRAALRDGIGSGKAFGFGLLSVAPVR